MINTAAYSFAAQAYGHDVEKVVSLFEGFVGIGTTSGPIIGSLVYHYVGFSTTFYIYGAVMVPSAFLICCVLPTPKQIRDARVSNEKDGDESTQLKTSLSETQQLLDTSEVKD